MFGRVCKNNTEWGVFLVPGLIVSCQPMILITRIGKDAMMGIRVEVVGPVGEGLLRYCCCGLWGVLDHLRLAKEDYQIRLKVTWHPWLQLVSCTTKLEE
ncbi:uncharacterized protein LOC132614726 isoform X2 [Lycium barbarum]|uniref:uncharacterized protein LOC132614726 isoform X2 n=1 Tax=Lycium barbarum TaxID=112863 RepID=UPI00293E439B|nr:uncharacterized protein LOC132614726 isoform X2 [Lycium barbarum]